jgi:hypothetical protein
MTEPEQHSWTLDTLRIHLMQMIGSHELRNNDRFTSLEQLIAGQDKAVQIAMTASDRAVTKAETAAEKRFESVNEFRAALADNARLLMPRAESETIFKNQSGRHDSDMATVSDKLSSGLTSMDGRISGLRTDLTQLQGKARGMQAGWGYAMGAVGLISMLLTFLMWLFHK